MEFLARFWPRFIRDWHEAVMQQLATAVFAILITVWLQYRRVVIRFPALEGSLFDFLFPYFAIAVLFALYHAYHTIKVLHDEDQATILELRAAMQAKVEQPLLQSAVLASLPVHRQDDISTKLLRLQLINHDPLAALVSDLYRAMKDDSCKTKCDFLFEVFLVNRVESPITIQKVVVEAQIDNDWILLTQDDNLEDYQIRFNDQLIDSPSWIGGQHPRVEDLAPNLAEDLRHSTLVRRVKHQGWLRFGAEINAKYLTGIALPYRLSLIDALDVVHTVSTGTPLLTDGDIIHNPRIWTERLRGH